MYIIYCIYYIVLGLYVLAVAVYVKKTKILSVSYVDIIPYQILLGSAVGRSLLSLFCLSLCPI